MSCRHRKYDPACSSYEGQMKALKREYEEQILAKLSTDTPDAERFQVIDAEQVGRHLVMKVQYPNCASCSYEGQKVMVFLDTTSLMALRWKRIDPHFRDDGYKDNGRDFSQAPSPAARFPASTQGWEDARGWAKMKDS